MNVFTRFAAGALFTAALGSAAAAEEWTGPRVAGDTENASVVYAAPSRNVVGGALTRVTGIGDNIEVEAIAAPVAQPGRAARVVGDGENTSVVYDGARG